MKWIKKEISSEEVRNLSRDYGISFLEGSILLRRGMSSGEDVAFFLEKDLGFTHNPFLFQDMEDAVDRILMAAGEEEKVLVFGDRDVDGITSTTLMVQSLREVGLDPFWQVPMGDDPYGLTKEAIQKAYDQEVSLVITVDCGISNLEEITFAVELGMDVIVVDHHEAPSQLPPALAIINPKTPGETYPYPSLAACGVVSKLAWALKLAQMDFYNQSFTLLHCQPTSEGGVSVHGAKIRNFLVSRVHEKIYPPDPSSQELFTLVDFLQGEEILVFGQEEQMEILRRLFGPRTDIFLTDFRPKLYELFPGLRGLDWIQIKEKSRMARYKGKEGKDLDILVNLLVIFLRKLHPSLDNYLLDKLDLVALGTLADLMPLKGENRILVGKGLEVLNRTTRPGLRALLGQIDLLGKKIDTHLVSWQLAPIINATGRMGVPHKAIELLLSEDQEQQGALAKELEAINKERRNLSSSSWDKIYPSLKEKSESGAGILVHQEDDIARGVTGILAARSVNTFGLTSVIVCRQDQRLIGSLRSVKGYPTLEVLESLSPYLDDFGGHAMAAGFSMKPDLWGEFLQALLKKTGDFKTYKIEEEIHLDAELPPAHMKPDVWESIEKFEPYGEGFRPLIFGVRGAVLEDFEFLGQQSKHLKFLFQFGEFKWPGIAWNSAQWVDEEKVKRGQKVDVAFHLEKNQFQGKENLRWNVLDLLPS